MLERTKRTGFYNGLEKLESRNRIDHHESYFPKFAAVWSMPETAKKLPPPSSSRKASYTTLYNAAGDAY